MSKEEIAYFIKWDLEWLIPESYENLKQEVLNEYLQETK